ncbi:cytochrome c oxidase assembly protein COX18, mitochondrial [Rhinatrema bivittatum]|uniref:cytochrome c oxidase assembly protein COX18, mitochondrial n=1 Tax=Rhinatrema bivittatum TaxID=194408 RepID=UPI00112B85B0|nr:cytochrome c oxidase assembly protein COX18, mitochondrial [Rhinatrema bivittatum]XP_029448160.1 cytochrome c oxidase assembly protein COX18, mitochondrial [Rhinatrema bivittatum]
MHCRYRRMFALPGLSACRPPPALGLLFQAHSFWKASASLAVFVVRTEQILGARRKEQLVAATSINRSLQGPWQGRTGMLACVSAASVSDSSGRPGWYESFADSAPVHLAENLLIGLQEASGLPWWANIICATVALRTAITLPLAAYQLYIIAKVENLQPEIESLAKRLRYEVSVYGKQKGWSEGVARFHFRKNLKRIISGLYVRDNCHPFKASLLMWIQIPMWVFISVALRNLSVTAFDSGPEGAVNAAHKQLVDGGVLWFPDLTLPDATWMLPVSLGLINLLIVEIFALRKVELSRFQKYVTSVIRGLSVLMIPIAASVPSCMALYWLSSSCVGLGHNLLLRSPAVRRVCRIPRTKSDSDTPYRDIAAGLLAKYSLKR